MDEYVLIDGNSVGHAAFQTQILTAGDLQTQAVYGFLRTLRAICIAHPSKLPIILWDGRSWRKGEAPEYKANRTDDAKKLEARARYKQQVPYIKRAISSLGITQMIAANLEADDLAAIMTKQFVARGHKVRLITGDEDWIQFVGPNVSWEDHRREDKRVDVWNFKEFTGVDTPDQFVELKALQGDVSDNLSGVGGVGPKKGLEIMSIWGSVDAFLSDQDPNTAYIAATEKKKLDNALSRFHSNESGGVDNFNKNMRLMSLIADYIPAPEKLKADRGEFSPEEFKKLCMELGFRSLFMEPNCTTYLLPFKRHHK